MTTKKWTEEAVRAAAADFQARCAETGDGATRNGFQLSNKGAYDSACRLGIIAELFPEVHKGAKRMWTSAVLKERIKEVGIIAEFRRKFGEGAYRALLRTENDALHQCLLDKKKRGTK